MSEGTERQIGLVNKESGKFILRCWFKYYNSKGVRKHFSVLYTNTELLYL